MKLKPKITLLDHFAKLRDPRVDRTKEHKLIDILAIAICGMISGAASLSGNGAIRERQGTMVEAVFRITKWDSFS